MRNKEYKKLKQERLYKKANRHHKTTTRDDRSPSRPQPKTVDGGKKHGPLTSYINSSYISAMNHLGGRNARQRIVAYVESYDDVFFWSNLLRPLETDKYYFEVMLPSRTSLCKGKK